MPDEVCGIFSNSQDEACVWLGGGLAFVFSEEGEFGVGEARCGGLKFKGLVCVEAFFLAGRGVDPVVDAAGLGAAGLDCEG